MHMKKTNNKGLTFVDLSLYQILEAILFPSLIGIINKVCEKQVTSNKKVAYVAT